MTLVDRHISFLTGLRDAGLPVSLAEGLDAARAMKAVDLVDRESLRALYAATVVKRQGHRRVFDELFDLWFPPALGAGVVAEDGPVPPSRTPSRVEVTGGRGTTGEVQEIRERLATLLFEGDDGGLAQLAREAVGRFGQIGGGAGGGSGSWSPSRVRDILSAKTLMAGLLRTALAEDEQDGLTEQLFRRRFAARIARFDGMIATEARRRIAEDRGTERIAASVIRPPLEQIDFLAATRSDLVQLRRELYPLAQRLATRMTIDHRHGRRGQLDFRRTIRASLASGGVPLTTQHKPRRPHKPELVVLCDTSASVAPFARFALLLIFALAEQFTRVRAFAFVDTITEITSHFTGGTDIREAVTRMEADPTLPWLRGGTHYGRAFSRFADRYPDAISPRTSLLVLGDARANYGDLSLDVYRSLARQARHTFWLNPEPHGAWGTGDSEAFAYADVAPMVECRNLAQLTGFVRDLA